MIKVELSDGKDGLRAEILRGFQLKSGFNDPIGLMVYSQPFEIQTRRRIFAANSDFGIDMNINATTGGVGSTTENIHDGNDSTLWTGSDEGVGTWDFSSTDQAFAGSQSIDATGTLNNSLGLFTRSSPIAFAPFTTFKGAIYHSAYNQSGIDELNFYFSLGGATISGEVNLLDYINVNVTNTWQEFSIPLTAFGLTGTTLDELYLSVDASPIDFYLDALQLEGPGSASEGPQTFVIAPESDEIIDIYGLDFHIVDDFDTIATVAGATENATSARLSYDKFGGITELTNGIVCRRVIDNLTVDAEVFKNNFEILRQTGGSIETNISDGTSTYIKMISRYKAPYRLYGARGDHISITITDDLSNLIKLQISAHASTVLRADAEIK